MGDYTSFQLTIYEIPNGKAEAVADLLNEQGLYGEWNTGIVDWDAAKVCKHVATGEQFTDHDYRVGNSSELVDALVALDVPFQCWEDPKYEWLGVLYMFHPDLGLLVRECDADGNITMPYAQIHTIGACHTSDAERWRRVVAFYGLEWEKKFAEYVKGEETEDDG